MLAALAACLLAVASRPLVLAQSPVALVVFDEVWQTVNDTFYDTSFGGVDWVAVRNELRPKAESLGDASALRSLVREMLARLHQSHFALLSSAPETALPGAAMVPIDVRATRAGVIVMRMTVDAPASLADVKPGDRLMAVDDQQVPELSAVVESDRRAAALAAWRRVFSALHGLPGSSAKLELMTPAGQLRTVHVPRVVESGDVVSLGNLPPLRVRASARAVQTPTGLTVGVIAFNAWMTTVAEPFAAAVDRFRASSGLVIDLRGNPGGLADMIRGIAGHVLSEPLLLGRMHMRSLELEFRANPRRSTTDGRRVEPYAGRLALLVDELTASASECFAGGLQSLSRARVFGAQTMGQALPAATRQLSNGDALMYAIGDFVTFDGRRLEGVGVIPDERVELEPSVLALGGDPALDAAVRWIERGR